MKEHYPLKLTVSEAVKLINVLMDSKDMGRSRLIAQARKSGVLERYTANPQIAWMSDDIVKDAEELLPAASGELYDAAYFLVNSARLLRLVQAQTGL